MDPDTSVYVTEEETPGAGVIGNESLDNKIGKDAITELLADTLSVDDGVGRKVSLGIEAAVGNEPM